MTKHCCYLQTYPLHEMCQLTLMQLKWWEEKLFLLATLSYSSCFTSSGTIYYILVWAWSVCIERLPLDQDYLSFKRKVNNWSASGICCLHWKYILYNLMKQLKLIVHDQIGHIKENPTNTGTLRTWLLLYIWDSDPRLWLDLSKKERKEIVYVCFLCIAKLRYGNREAVAWSYCSKRLAWMPTVETSSPGASCTDSRTWRGWSHCHLFILSEWDLWSSFPYFSFLTKKKNDRECFIQFDPAERISAKEAMEHPYFDGLDKSQFESALCPFNLIWSQLWNMKNRMYLTASG